MVGQANKKACATKRHKVQNHVIACDAGHAHTKTDPLAELIGISNLLCDYHNFLQI